MPSPNPYSPWSFQSNHSSSSLASQGMEISVPPGQYSPVSPLTPMSTGGDYITSKELPPIPREQQQRMNRRNDQPTRPNYPFQRTDTSSASYRSTGEASSRPSAAYTPHSSPPPSPRSPAIPPRSPITPQRSIPPRAPIVPTGFPAIPPISKSSHKILQLTGFDPRFEKAFPKDHQQPPVSPSSDSSGSIYSQPEASVETDDTSRQSHFSSWGSAPSNSQQQRQESQDSYLQASTYKSDDSKASSRSSVQSSKYIDRQHEISSSPPATSLRHHDRAGKMLKNGKVITPVYTGSETEMDEMTTLRELLVEEQVNDVNTYSEVVQNPYHRNFTDAELDTPVPKPLRTKKVTIQSPRRPSMLANVRDNFAVGVHEITTPTKTRRFSTPDWQTDSPIDIKDPTIPVTPAATRFSLESIEDQDRPFLFKPKKRTFGTGKHPMKSPFPFGKLIETSESEDSDEAEKREGKKFSKRLSGAMKKVSHSARIRQTSVIRNAKRDPNGPDTPLPTRPGFNDHVHDALASAKKSLTLKSANEKKRESLKKKIVVVGITDQGPDGRVSEWL